MKVKICGVTSVPDARLCVDEGADYIGLIFAKISKRRITPGQAKRIIKTLPRSVTPVAVVMDQELEDVRGLIRTCGDAKNYGRVFLSGRLEPETLGEKVAQVKPFGIDACTCTESRPGKKDKRRVRAFVEAARA
jgi:phosphoribosylanthranilate isomerase